jgi:hypothetical protein
MVREGGAPFLKKRWGFSSWGVQGGKGGPPILLTTNEWYKPTKLRNSYRLNMVWGPFENPNGEQIYTPNPAQKIGSCQEGN